MFHHLVKIGDQKLAQSDPNYDRVKTDFLKRCPEKFKGKTRKCVLAAQQESHAFECIRDQGGADMVAAYNRYQRNLKTAEARQLVRKLYEGAREYYMARKRGGESAGLAVTPFPSPSVGPTPQLGSCCQNPGGKCEPNAKQWTGDVWTALKFSVDEPHYYSYSYTVMRDVFTARANGDLDCDGVYSTFELFGETRSDSPARLSDNPPIYRENELE